MVRLNFEARLGRIERLREFQKELRKSPPFRGFTWTGLLILSLIAGNITFAEQGEELGSDPVELARTETGDYAGEGMPDEQGFFRAGPVILGEKAPFELTAETGDTLAGIAAKFNLKPETLAWANPHITDEVHTGDTLTIPQADGVLHSVGASEDLEKISSEYGVEEGAIHQCNYRYIHATLTTGRMIFIPGGKPLAVTETANLEGTYLIERTAVKTTPTRRTPSKSGIITPSKSGILIVPTDGRVTQRFYAGHRGLDLATRTGTPVVAAKGGTVIAALTSGYNGGYGKYVLVDHGGGIITRYAHLSKVEVSKGDDVSAGVEIGQVGSTGRSTGPHLHFEVIQDGVQRNPQAYF